MANPFDDPDVQAAATGGDQPSNNVYGGGAYDNNTNTTSSGMNQAQQDMAMKVGTAVAAETANNVKNDVQNDYNAQSQQQGDHYSAPEAPSWCSKTMQWLPIRYVAWIGGIALFVAPILDAILPGIAISFVYGVVGVYLVFFAIIIIIVESPVFKLTRKPQLAIFYWFRLLSRMWGRSWFYFFVSILCFIEIAQTFTIGFLVGIYIFITALFMLIISRQAATKYRRMFDFIAAGTDPEAQDEMAGKITRKFDELDLDQDGKIGSLEVVKLAEQSGRSLSNAERHAIQTFLDTGCNGAIARDDFVNQFMNHNSKMKWL